MQPKALCFNPAHVCMSCHWNPSVRNASATRIENLPFNFNPPVSCLSLAKSEAEKTEIEEAVINCVMMDIHQRSSLTLPLSHEKMLRAAIQASPVAMQVWKRLSACITGATTVQVQPTVEVHEAKWDHMWTLSRTHNHTHPRGISRLLPSWFALPHKTHTATQLTTIEGGLLWNWKSSGVLVWRVELSLCFCFLVLSACTLKRRHYAWHKERGFSRSDIQPAGCQFHLSCSMLFSALTAPDSDACLWNFLYWLCGYQYM